MTDADRDLVAHVATWTIPDALAWLPAPMDTPAARALVLAIGLQESGFTHRRQANRGAARGFWQFEAGGVAGVWAHRRTQPLIGPICQTLAYDVTEGQRVTVCHVAIEHHDVLAAVFARLLLWTDPRALPASTTAFDAAIGWTIYQAAWRPGRPRPDAWPAHYAQAWALVDRK